MSWKKVNLIQQEIAQPEKPIEGGEPVEGEGEQQPPPEPVYETVEQISELGENAIISNSKVTLNAHSGPWLILHCLQGYICARHP